METNNTQAALERIFCQTKTGTKVHATTSKSSRTDCGAKVARRWPAGQKPGEGAHYCGGCGLDNLNTK